MEEDYKTRLKKFLGIGSSKSRILGEKDITRIFSKNNPGEIEGRRIEKTETDGKTRYFYSGTKEEIKPHLSLEDKQAMIRDFNAKKRDFYPKSD